jgi:hypothetical protein
MRMNCRDDQSPDRLNAMLARIAVHSLNEEDAHLDLVRRRTDIAKAVDMLVELYGEQALDRATLLEGRSAVPGFARSVREALAARIATDLARPVKTS